MTNTKMCPSCNKENPVTTAQCTNCGTPFLNLLPASTTLRIPEHTSKFPFPEHSIQALLQTNAIAIVIIGHDKPVLLKSNTKIVLGRVGFADETQPTIDLTPYNGVNLGVSRQHAAISHPGEYYVIQDLGSTNGTYLNETRLVKDKFYNLTSGDLIRLGQLAFYIFFNTTTDTNHRSTITLRPNSNTDTTPRITLSSLKNEVIPFLHALNGLQNTCTKLMSQPHTEIIIHRIQSDTKLNEIEIEISKGDRAINLLSQINTWTEENNKNTYRQSKLETHRQITSIYLEQIAPNSSEAQRTSSLDEATPFLEILINNTLQLSTISQPI